MTQQNELKPRNARKAALLKPSAWVLAGLLGVGLIGANLTGLGQTAAQAESAAPQSVMTPYGAAPLSFADLAAKVRPAVVSIHVKNGGPQLGQNFDFRGMPDLPDAIP